MSTRETALSMDMLLRLDKEILIGQISYKQRADIYNAIHGYSGDNSRYYKFYVCIIPYVILSICTFICIIMIIHVCFFSHL